RRDRIDIGRSGQLRLPDSMDPHYGAKEAIGSQAGGGVLQIAVRGPAYLVANSHLFPRENGGPGVRIRHLPWAPAFAGESRIRERQLRRWRPTTFISSPASATGRSISASRTTSCDASASTGKVPFPDSPSGTGCIC